MAAAQCVSHRLPDERLLGAEVTVEAAVSQPGSLHHLSDRDAVESTLPEQARGGGKDKLSVALDLIATDLRPRRSSPASLASRLERETTATVDLLKADLTASDELARVEARLREDHRIGILVNNAGAAAHGSFADPDLDATERLIRLNVTALTRLAGAVIPRYLQQGGGAIVNLASVLALVPEFPMGAYGATKAYVLALSQNLQSELGSRGIYVQAVQPNFFNTRPAERYLTG